MRRTISVSMISVSMKCLSTVGLLALSACGTNGAGGGSMPSADMAMAPAVDMQTKAFDYVQTMKTFDLQPGDEKIFCQYVPADGVERYVRRFDTEMSPGSHHLVVFRVDETRGRPASTDLEPCTQLEIPAGFDGMLPGSQELHSDYSLPEGVAFLIGAQHGLLFQMHYINATKAPLTARVSWSLGTIPKEQVKMQAGMLFYSNFGLSIPPGMSTATVTCKAPADMSLATATGHMHKHGLTFDASVAGRSVFHTDNWDEPKGSIFPLPGEPVKAGDPITWACAYNNDTMNTLHFGNSAVTDEMCIFASLYYPATPNGTEFNCIK